MKYFTYGVLESHHAAEIAEDMNMSEEQAAKTWFSEVLWEAEWDEVDELPTYRQYVDDLDDGWELYYDYGASYYFAVKENDNENEE